MTTQVVENPVTQAKQELAKETPAVNSDALVLDLKPIYENFGEAIRRFEDLLSQSQKAFLIGAGCSKCAKLPLTTELTQKALESSRLSGTSKSILSEIQRLFEGSKPPAHIEDLLSELIDLLAIANRRTFRKASNQTVSLGGTDYTELELSAAAEEIKHAIADVIDQKVAISTHQRFVEALHRPLRPGKRSPNQLIDYLVLNYDTVVEDALALARIPFSDGMDGGVSGWWNPATYDRDGLGARVFKLHGSINWHALADSSLPQRVSSTVDISTPDSRKILIWPASTKYRETQLDPYAQLAERARKVLMPHSGTQTVLVICGYSFGDSHINIEIERGLKNSSGNLTVIAFTNEDRPSGKLEEWHADKSISEQVLIYANKGFFHGKEVRDSDKPLPWWKFEYLTRILEGGQ